MTSSKESSNPLDGTNNNDGNDKEDGLPDKPPRGRDNIAQTIYNVGGLFIGILSILAAFWISASERKEPRLSVSSILQTSLLEGDVQRPAIEVTYDGNSILDPWLERLRIQNTGTVPIDKSDIKQALSVNYETGKLVNVTLQPNYPQSIAPTINIDKSRIVISNFFLNPDSYFDLEILFDGQPSQFEASAIISQMTRSIILHNYKQLRSYVTGFDVSDNIKRILVTISAITSIVFVFISIMIVILSIMDVISPQSKEVDADVLDKIGKLTYEDFKKQIIMSRFRLPVEAIAWKMGKYAFFVRDYIEDKDWWRELLNAPDDLLGVFSITRDALSAKIDDLKEEIEREMPSIFARFVLSFDVALYRSEYRALLEEIFIERADEFKENPARAWRGMISEIKERFSTIRSKSRSTLLAGLGQIGLALAVFAITSALAIVVAGPVRSITGWW